MFNPGPSGDDLPPPRPPLRTFYMHAVARTPCGVRYSGNLTIQAYELTQEVVYYARSNFAKEISNKYNVELPLDTVELDMIVELH